MEETSTKISLKMYGVLTYSCCRSDLNMHTSHIFLSGPTASIVVRNWIPHQKESHTRHLKISIFFLRSLSSNYPFHSLHGINHSLCWKKNSAEMAKLHWACVDTRVLFFSSFRKKLNWYTMLSVIRRKPRVLSSPMS